MKKVEVYTDGSATSRPLPGGWSYVLVIDGVKHSEGSGHVDSASNNDMEMQAAIEGLKAALDIIRDTIPEVTLCSDSQIVLGWASGSYKFKQTEPDKVERFTELSRLMKTLKAKTQWIKGHSGNEYNERCDQLANEARTGQKKAPKKAKNPRTFKWNEGQKAFWDQKDGEIVKEWSDRRTIANPIGVHTQELLGALCRVVSELVEIEESRNK